jgi:two-component system chemotaxis sensor kinase CheA
MLLLKCKDHVSIMVRLSVDSSPYPQEVLDEDAHLKAMVQHYLNPKKYPKPSGEEEVSVVKQTVLVTKGWHLSLFLKDSFFETGMDLISILSFLRKSVTIQSITPLLDILPDIKKIDPFFPYIAFEIDFVGDIDKSEIEEAFEFVEDDVELYITPLEVEEICAQEELKTEGEEEFVEPVLEESSVVQELIEQPKVETKIQAPTEQKTPPKAPAQSLRVDSQKIDSLIDIISEMVIANAKIARHVEENFNVELEEISLEFDALLQQLRDNVMNIRMVPVGESFEKFRRVVSDVAYKLGKKINFTILGGDTELDKTVIEKIADPLIHMLRNAVDHGIEKPDVRMQNGKEESGNVTLRTYPESGSIIIEIEDDGKGLSKEFLMNKAISKGMIAPNQIMSDSEAFNLIFAPGFSTAEVISDISGRGVGMDVVKKNIEALKGKVELSSVVGQGSKFTIKLPLTLAIIDGFLFQVGKTSYIIPLDMVVEVVEHVESAKYSDNIFDLRGSALPLLHVREFYNEEACEVCDRRNIIVVSYGRDRMGLLVDELYGEHQTVIKSLGKLFENAPALYGASILGTGEMALIFDIPALFELVKKESR